MCNDMGSEWHRWDLHLHTASSYDYKYMAPDADELLCDQLRKNNIKAVAITDHWKIDQHRISKLRELAPDIVFFPGVELRTDKGAKNLHVILIFSNECDIGVLSQDFDAIMIRKCAKSSGDDRTIYWSFENILEFAREHDALITIHAGHKTNGVDEQIKNGIPVNEAIKEDIAAEIDFFEIGQRRDIDEYEKYVFTQIPRKPLIICSDNHDPREYSVNEYLWIKADLTFEGLKQCMYQPQERVYIGEIPSVLDRLNKNLQYNIRSIGIKRIDSPDNPSVNWFDVEMPINPGMVAVIGSKGSGKSAFSDIIACLCKSNTMGSASFLNDKRFRKAPMNYARDYEASLTWADGEVFRDNLGNIGEDSAIEYAQYLPQKYIEDVCNDFGDVFQQEIDKVIFSYVDDTERGDSQDLNGLITAKSEPVNTRINELQSRLKNLNKRIIELENKKTKSYQKSVQEGLKNSQELLARHEKSKPSEVLKPKPKASDSQYQTQLNDINEQLRRYQDDKNKILNNIAIINAFIDETNAVLALVDALREQYNTTRSSIIDLSDKFDLKITTPLFNLDTICDELKNLLRSRAEERASLKAKLDTEDTGIDAKIKQLNEDKAKLIATSGNEERQYQKYLSDLQEWNNKRDSIIGNVTTQDTVAYYLHESEYINESLDAEYEQVIGERDEIVRSLYQCTSKYIQICQDIYAPIQCEISGLLGDLNDGIVFNAEISAKRRELIDTITNSINSRYSGKFGKGHNAEKEIDDLLRETNFASEEDVIRLVHNISEVVTENLDNAEKRIQERDKFYDYIFGLEYLKVNFKLKMGGRNLEELSPGERGIVLLIFYLALSKEYKPIIIDQPEDNLDNQSVYDRLVPCICRAKQRRQVIIVTHNPNIAVACDAEQIVFCDMDKHSSHINYVSGPIEDPVIKKHVVDVLEGTMPAFELRQKKYK